MAQIEMKFDYKSMLNMLSKSLYDTPLVLLRENLQNAYDAVLMRQYYDKTFTNPQIDIHIRGNKIEVIDNGIGMTEDEIEKNFWTAGKSGKNNDEARAAGVVGTFGIGAFANFGVCDKLELVTQKVGSNLKCICKADKDHLDNIECVTQEVDTQSYGTSITIIASDGRNIIEDEALKYLSPYVSYINIPVYINGTLISCKDYRKGINEKNMVSYEGKHNGDTYKFDYLIDIRKPSPISSYIYLKNIEIENTSYQGDILLDTDYDLIWGLRNGFGLSTIPLYSNYNFGGLANLTMLEPTAGREAINKICIEILQRLINIVEIIYTDYISKEELADSYREYQQYVRNHFEIRLAYNIKIQVANDEKKFIRLYSVLQEKDKFKYYVGNDTSILSIYKNNDEVVVVSKENPRRFIQLKFLTQTKIQQVEDKIEILKVYDYVDLDIEYFTIGNIIQQILKSDYLILNNKVVFSEISHNISVYVREEDDIVCVYINVKDENELPNLISIYKGEYPLLGQLLKDYVRNYIYQQISPYIPTSKKSGIAALCNMLKKNNELFSIYSDDAESFDKYLDLFKKGEITEEELSDKFNKNFKRSQQTVEANNIADVESVLPTINTDAILSNASTGHHVKEAILEPLPPINRQDVITNAKLLITDVESYTLHGYKKFLSLTEKMYNEYYYFFFSPHTTKVIWSMHRIIYIFTLGNEDYTLYYNLELKKHLDNNLTGGVELQTSTIITKDKIFIPIPHALEDYFSPDKGTLKFIINYDTIDG